MKKFMLALALLFATLVVVPQAEAFLQCCLVEKEDWLVLVDGAQTAVTITWVRGKALTLAGHATARTGQPASLTGKLPKKVSRMIVEVDPPLNGSAKVTVEQASGRLEDATQILGDTRFVFDVAPAP